MKASSHNAATQCERRFSRVGSTSRKGLPISKISRKPIQHLPVKCAAWRVGACATISKNVLSDKGGGGQKKERGKARGLSFSS